MISRVFDEPYLQVVRLYHANEQTIECL